MRSIMNGNISVVSTFAADGAIHRIIARDFGWGLIRS